MIISKKHLWFPLLAASCLAPLACRPQQQASAPAEPATAPAPAPVAAEAPPPAPEPLTGDALAAFYGSCWQKFNEKKWDEFSACYADDAVATRGTAWTLQGKQQIIADTQGFASAFPDVTGEQQLTLVNGTHVTSINLVRGTHSAPLPLPDGNAIPATNKKIGMMTVLTVDVDPAAGKAVKSWEASDGPTMMAQLGLSPAPARAVITEGWPEKLVVIAKGDETEAKNVELHKKAYELFNAHDKAMFELLTDKSIDRDYCMPADTVGKKEIGMKLSALWKGFSDMKLNAEQMWGAGEYTFAAGTLTGTNDGAIPSLKLMKKTGKTVNVRFGEVAAWEGDKLKWVAFFMDSMDMATQLGMVPPPPAAKK